MKAFLSMFALAAATSLQAQGNLEAMVGYVGTTSPNYGPIFSSQPGPVGWAFQPLTDISVTALGAWAYALPSGGLEVGLWNESGTLLASNTVKTTSTLVDQSRYSAITPVMLMAGQTYVIAAYCPAGPFDCIAVVPGDESNGYATMDSNIQLGTAVAIQNAGFAFPTTVYDAPGSAIVAPNFEFVPVPEPGALLGLGLGTLGWVSLRRRS